jgi:hypothetical protein
MRIFVLTATYELRVSRKSHLRDHPTAYTCILVSYRRLTPPFQFSLSGVTLVYRISMVSTSRKKKTFSLQQYTQLCV